MSCKYNNCEHCGYKSECEIYKENAELKKENRCECTRCVYSDSPCIRSDYGVEKDEDVCPNYKNVFGAYSQLKAENTELKDKSKRDNNIIEALKKQIAEMDLYITKAIEIIKGLMRFCRCFAQHHTEDIRYKEAEQFLKEE